MNDVFYVILTSKLTMYLSMRNIPTYAYKHAYNTDAEVIQVLSKNVKKKQVSREITIHTFATVSQNILYLIFEVNIWSIQARG